MLALGSRRLTDDCTDKVRLVLATAVNTAPERVLWGTEGAGVWLVCVDS